MEDNTNIGFDFSDEAGTKDAEELAALIYGDDLYPSVETINQKYRDFYKLSHLLTLQLTALYEGGNDYESTHDTLGRLLDALQPGNWIEPFLTDNKEVFNIVNGLQVQKPKFYYSLDEKGRKGYDEARRYYIDTTNLKPTFSRMFELMQSIQGIKYMYRISHAYDMLVDNGYDDSLYKTIDNDFDKFSTFLKESYDSIEGSSDISRRFYFENCSKLGDDALKAGYLDKRWEDFDKVMKSFSLSFISGKAKSRYNVNPDRKLKLSTIDNYTADIVEISDALNHVTNDMDAVIKAAEKVELAVNGVPGYNHDGSRTVANDFCALAGIAKAFAGRVKEIREGFMNKMDKAPYCFMRLVPNYKSNDPKGLGYSLPSVEPRKDGTAYVAAYIEMARVLNKFAEEFVNNHGTYFKK